MTVLVGAGLIGAVAVLIFLILIAQGGRESANRAYCRSHMRQIGEALRAYADANIGVFPPSLFDLARSADLPFELFLCASGEAERLDSTGKSEAELRAAFDDPSHRHCSFMYVRPPDRMQMNGLNDSSSIVLLYEPLDNHDRVGIHALFADGHHDWVSGSSAKGRQSPAERLIEDAKAGVRPLRVR